MKQLTFLFILFSLAACNRHAVPMRTTVETKDSVHVETVTKYKDTTIFVAGDSVEIHDTVPCLEAAYSKEVKSDRVTATVSLKHGLLNVKCDADSLKIIIKFLESQLTTISRMKQETVTRFMPVDVVKYKVPKWCWWLLLINVVVVAWYYRHGIIAIIQTLFLKWRR